MSQSVFSTWFREKTNPTADVPAAGTISVGTSLTKILLMDVRNWQFCSFVFVNGGTALNAFQVRVKGHPEQPSAMIVMSTTADFATNDSIFRGISLNAANGAQSALTDMTGLGIGFSALLNFDVRGIASLEFWASVGSGTSLVSAYVGANG